MDEFHAGGFVYPKRLARERDPARKDFHPECYVALVSETTKGDPTER